MLRAFGLASRPAGRMGEWRDPGRVRHSIADMMAARMLAIAAGYEDCDDRSVPAPRPGRGLIRPASRTLTPALPSAPPAPIHQPQTRTPSASENPCLITAKRQPTDVPDAKTTSVKNN
jgi:hypothetical protein